MPKDDLLERVASRFGCTVNWEDVAAFVRKERRQAQIEVLEACAKAECSACKNGDTPTWNQARDLYVHVPPAGIDYPCGAQYEIARLAELRKEEGE